LCLKYEVHHILYLNRIYKQITSKSILGIPNIISLEEDSIQENAYLKFKQGNVGNISKEWDEALLKLY